MFNFSMKAALTAHISSREVAIHSGETRAGALRHGIDFDSCGSAAAGWRRAG
jgi:hypothetical protein